MTSRTAWQTWADFQLVNSRGERLAGTHFCHLGRCSGDGLASAAAILPFFGRL
jgi:hypothetical protein